MIFYAILYDFGHIIYVRVDLMDFHRFGMLPNLCYGHVLILS